LERAANAISNGALSSCPAPSQIFPVLVCADKAMECFGMNRYLNQLFQELFVSRPYPIRPLTIVSIDELEQVLPYTADGRISWQEFFNSRFDGDEVRILSVHQRFYEIQRDRRLEPLRNDYLLKRFDEMWLRIMNQYAHVRADEGQDVADV